MFFRDYLGSYMFISLFRVRLAALNVSQNTTFIAKFIVVKWYRNASTIHAHADGQTDSHRHLDREVGLRLLNFSMNCSLALSHSGGGGHIESAPSNSWPAALSVEVLVQGGKLWGDPLPKSFGAAGRRWGRRCCDGRGRCWLLWLSAPVTRQNTRPKLLLGVRVGPMGDFKVLAFTLCLFPFAKCVRLALAARYPANRRIPRELKAKRPWTLSWLDTQSSTGKITELLTKSVEEL